MSKDFLLENISVDTVGTPIFGDGAEKSLTVWGTAFGGGAVTLDISDNGSDFVPVTENGGNIISFTANTSRVILKIPSTQLVRASLTGSAGASGVNVVMSG